MVLRQRPSSLLVPGGMVAAFLIAAAFRWLTLAEFPNDHFDQVALAQQLRLGALPVRDFTDEGLPLTYVVSALAWTLLKAPFLAEAVVVAVGFALAAALSFRSAALMSHSLTAAALAAAAQVALYPRTYSYPKLLVQSIAVAVAWWAVERLNSPVRIAALSAATALGYYFRHDHALYLGLATIVLLVAANWRTGGSTVARSLTLYVALVGVFVLPHLAYVQWAVGVPTYFASAREYSGSEARGGTYRLPVASLDTQAGLWLRPDMPTVNVRWVPGLSDDARRRLEQRYRLEVVERAEGTTWRYRVLDATAANVRALRDDRSVEDTHGVDRLEETNRASFISRLRLGPGWRVHDNSIALLFWLCWLLPAAALALLYSQRHVVSAPHTAGIVMLAALAVCANLGFLRSPLEIRLPDVAVPQTILGAWVGALIWRWPSNAGRHALRRGCVVVATAATLIAITVLSQAGQLVSATGIGRGVGGVVQRWREVTALVHSNVPGPVPSNPSSLLLPFFEYVRACTGPNDRLLYAWYAPEVFIVADRGFAGDRKFNPPFHASPAEQARTIERIRKERVPFVLIPLTRRHIFESGFPDVSRYIKSRYVSMATLPDGDPAGIEILRESSWTSSRLYGTTNWPCVESPALPPLR